MNEQKRADLWMFFLMVMIAAVSLSIGYVLGVADAAQHIAEVTK